MKDLITLLVSKLNGQPKRAMELLLKKFEACSPTTKRQLNSHLAGCIKDLKTKFLKDKTAFDSLASSVGINECLEWTNRRCVSYN